MKVLLRLCWVLAKGHEFAFGGQRVFEFATRLDAELAEDVFEVALYGLAGDEQGFGDLPVRLSLDRELCDALLGGRERRRSRARG